MLIGLPILDQKNQTKIWPLKALIQTCIGHTFGLKNWASPRAGIWALGPKGNGPNQKVKDITSDYKN